MRYLLILTLLFVSCQKAPREKTSKRNSGYSIGDMRCYVVDEYWGGMHYKLLFRGGNRPVVINITKDSIDVATGSVKIRSFVDAFNLEAIRKYTDE